MSHILKEEWHFPGCHQQSMFPLWVSHGGMILCRSHAGSHSCCEFVSVVFLLQEDILLWPLPIPGSHNLSIPLFHDSFWGRELAERVQNRHLRSCLSTLLTLILQSLTSCEFLCHCTKKFLWDMRVTLINVISLRYESCTNKSEDLMPGSVCEWIHAMFVLLSLG